MLIRPARRRDAPIIAQLIMVAMSNECCQYFVGEEHTLAEFEEIMTALAAQENTQYSFRNTLCAVDNDDNVIGISVAYDGAQLHTLRQPFLDSIRQRCGRDLRGMDDETAAGEYYIDSLAVIPAARRQGIATALLRATIARARHLARAAATTTPAEGALKVVGLLVDDNNPRAERLYHRVGFRYVAATTWGGHPMRRLHHPL